MCEKSNNLSVKCENPFINNLVLVNYCHPDCCSGKSLFRRDVRFVLRKNKGFIFQSSAQISINL